MNQIRSDLLQPTFQALLSPKDAFSKDAFKAHQRSTSDLCRSLRDAEKAERQRFKTLCEDVRNAMTQNYRSMNELCRQSLRPQLFEGFPPLPALPQIPLDPSVFVPRVPACIENIGVSRMTFPGETECQM